MAQPPGEILAAEDVRDAYRSERCVSRREDRLGLALAFAVFVRSRPEVDRHGRDQRFGHRRLGPHPVVDLDRGRHHVAVRAEDPARDLRLDRRVADLVENDVEGTGTQRGLQPGFVVTVGDQVGDAAEASADPRLRTVTSAPASRSRSTTPRPKYRLPPRTSTFFMSTSVTVAIRVLEGENMGEMAESLKDSRSNRGFTESSLDVIDRRLLELLQEEGRITLSELGRRVSLSPPLSASASNGSKPTARSPATRHSFHLPGSAWGCGRSCGWRRTAGSPSGIRARGRSWTGRRSSNSTTWSARTAGS